MLANLLFVGLIGPGVQQFAAGLANGLSTYVTTSVQFVSVDIGTFGAGSGSGAPVLVPPFLVQAMISSFTAHGIVGPMAVPTATGIAYGIMQSFLFAEAETDSVGVGVGVGVGVCVPNPSKSVGVFRKSFKENGMAGPGAERMAAAVALAIDVVLPTSTGPVVIVGPPSLLPGSGFGSGRIT